MSDINNLFTSLFGLSEITRGADIASEGAEQQAMAILQGGEYQATGSLMDAAAARQAQKTTKDITTFNLGIDAINLKRRIEDLNEQFGRVRSRQLSQMAKTGISVASKSFLQIQNETSNSFENKLLEVKIDAENSKRNTIFQRDMRIANLENQAIASEYQAKVNRIQAGNQAAEARFTGELAQFKAQTQVAKAIPTIASELFSVIGDF